jgi:hypothetical protein
MDVEAAVLATSVIFVAVATPSEPDGGFFDAFCLCAKDRLGVT